MKEAATSITAKLNQGELSENDQAALKSSVVSILPLSERYERLFRTTEVDDLKEFSTRLESSGLLIPYASPLQSFVNSKN